MSDKDENFSEPWLVLQMRFLDWLSSCPVGVKIYQDHELIRDTEGADVSSPKGTYYDDTIVTPLTFVVEIEGEAK